MQQCNCILTPTYWATYYWADTWDTSQEHVFCSWFMKTWLHSATRSCKLIFLKTIPNPKLWLRYMWEVKTWCRHSMIHDQWLTLAMAMTQPNWILRFFDHSLFISSILLAAVKPRLQVRCWPKLEVPYLGKLQCRTVKDKGFIPIYRESAHGCTACSTGAMTLLQRFHILDNGFPVQAQTSTFFHIHCVFHHW